MAFEAGAGAWLQRAKAGLATGRDARVEQWSKGCGLRPTPLAYHAGVWVLDEDAFAQQRDEVFNVDVGVLCDNVLHEAVEHLRAALDIGVWVGRELAREWGGEWMWVL